MISIFNSISGTLTRKIAGTQASQACITVNGIEFICEVSRTSLQDLPGIGSEATLYTWLYHREDQMYFCGFAREDERSMFLDLLKVEGIGAKQALKVLSSISSSRLAHLLDSGDVDGLEMLPGLGKKTAQKMVLALKGKLNVALIDTPRVGGSPAVSLGPYEDIGAALVAMGYDRKAVVEVIGRIASEFEQTPQADRESQLMRRAIIELS